MMKTKAGPAVIAGAVVILVLFLFFMYRRMNAPASDIPPEAAAQHKDMASFYRNQGQTSPPSGK